MGNTLEKVVLNDVDITTLKGLFKESLLVNTILSFEITKNTIKSITPDANSCVFKQWEVEYDTDKLSLFEVEQDDLEYVKVCIFNGASFIKDILNYFENGSSITIYHDGGEAKKISLKSVDGNFQITINTTPLKIGFEELSVEDEESIWYSGEDGLLDGQKKASFTISKDNLGKIMAVSKIANDDPQEYIVFEGDGKEVVANDNIFKKAIGSQEGDAFYAELSKTNLPFLSQLDYRVTYFNDGDIAKFIFESNNIKTAMVLLKQVTTEEGDEEEFDDVDWGNF